MELLKDKNVIITGSAQGIGFAIAEKFADNGANIVITDINIDKAKEAADKISQKGVSAIAIKSDVSNSDDVEALVSKTIEKFGSLDVIVNNAGITKDNLLIRMKESEWDAVLNINLKGVFLCTKAAGKVMMKQRYGCIINISSVVGVMGNPGQVNYSSAKAGVIGMTKTVAKELSSRNVRVNAIAPGFIDTAMTQALPEKARDNLIGLIPLKRLGLPEDIANTALFLSSSLSSYITGQVLIVDGGMVM